MKAKVVYNNIGVNMEAPLAKKVTKSPQIWQKFPQNPPKNVILSLDTYFWVILTLNTLKNTISPPFFPFFPILKIFFPILSFFPPFFYIFLWS